MEKKKSTSDKTETLNEKKENIKRSFTNLLKQVKERQNLGEVLKSSNDLFSQLKDTMPEQFEKLQENITENIHLLKDPPKIKGIETKVSVIKEFEVSSDSTVEDNIVTGSQIVDLSVIKTAEFKKNKVTGSSISKLTVKQTDFCSNTLTLSKISEMDLSESKFELNKITRGVLQQLVENESDVNSNLFNKTSFIAVTVASSRLFGNEFVACDFKDCKFEFVDIQNIEFINCKFHNCQFKDLEIHSNEKVQISNLNIHDRVIAQNHTVEDFLKSLDSQEN